MDGSLEGELAWPYIFRLGIVHARCAGQTYVGTNGAWCALGLRELLEPVKLSSYTLYRLILEQILLQLSIRLRILHIPSLHTAAGMLRRLCGSNAYINLRLWCCDSPHPRPCPYSPLEPHLYLDEVSARYAWSSIWTWGI